MRKLRRNNSGWLSLIVPKYLDTREDIIIWRKPNKFKTNERIDGHPLFGVGRGQQGRYILLTTFDLMVRGRIKTKSGNIFTVGQTKRLSM